MRSHTTEYRKVHEAYLPRFTNNCTQRTNSRVVAAQIKKSNMARIPEASLSFTSPPSASSYWGSLTFRVLVLPLWPDPSGTAKRGSRHLCGAVLWALARRGVCTGRLDPSLFLCSTCFGIQVIFRFGLPTVLLGHVCSHFCGASPPQICGSALGDGAKALSPGGCSDFRSYFPIARCSCCPWAGSRFMTSAIRCPRAAMFRFLSALSGE